MVTDLCKHTSIKSEVCSVVEMPPESRHCEQSPSPLIVAPVSWRRASAKGARDAIKPFQAVVDDGSSSVLVLAGAHMTAYSAEREKEGETRNGG